MLSKERKVVIMELLKRDGFVTVQQLMNVLEISRSSVMRDLDELEKDRLIVREHGGASLLTSEELLSRYNEPAVREKVHINEKEKQSICAKAATYLKNGDCIYIDSGTTAMYIIDYILDKSVDIVSPNTYILSRIPDNYKGNVYLLGGQYYKQSEICCGSLTLEMLKNFNFDWAFLTANGISYVESKAYSFDFNYAALKKEALKRTKKSVLLVDQSKNEQKGLCVWADLDDFDLIITDQFHREKKLKNLVTSM